MAKTNAGPSTAQGAKSATCSAQDDSIVRVVKKQEQLQFFDFVWRNKRTKLRSG
jgi:hypothetical protein